ncbi:hypothetical protein J4E91_006943 [Alternaria rosae]|nr:hypothetical protein J4E91_006943 [Alternaria rosae]
MKRTILSTIILLPLAYSRTTKELCSGTAELSSDGNWYCSEVWAITYRNISQPGAYNRTTAVDPQTGLCGHERVNYPSTGPLAPLFGQVSMHLRGPMNVSQLAVYQLPDEMHTMKKRTTVPFYNHRRSLEQPETTVATDATTRPTQSTSSGWFNLFNRNACTTTASCTSTTASDWGRIAYYTSTSPAQATGLSFMANLGDPQKSGTFDYAFGNSLSYVTPRGDKVAAESQPFEGTLNTSENEIVVLSDKECDADCPYWRPDATSHYGWSGSSKAFFIEFQMDHYDNVGTDQGLLSDAPAYWFLNAAIPRILQYGNDRNNVPCSCWSTGCGEFDAFELLSKGAERAKSTIHRQGNLEGGDSNYFSRPVGKKMKFAAVWHYPHITALVLDDNFDFSESMSNDAMQKLVAYDSDSWVHSLYAIGD